MSFQANLGRKGFRALLLYQSVRCARLEAATFAKDRNGELNLTSGRTVYMPSGAVITFGVLNDPSDLQRFVGQEFQHIEFVESPPSKELVDKMALRCRKFNDIEQEFIPYPPLPVWRRV